MMGRKRQDRSNPSLRAKRSNPHSPRNERQMDCFVAALLAMTIRETKDYFGASAVLHGLESFTSNLPSAPEMTKSL
jgi:hypothetical protein